MVFAIIGAWLQAGHQDPPLLIRVPVYRIGRVVQVSFNSMSYDVG